MQQTIASSLPHALKWKLTVCKNWHPALKCSYSYMGNGKWKYRIQLNKSIYISGLLYLHRAIPIVF